MSNFENLGLNPKIITALNNKGYTTPTPIQQQSIPYLLKGRDLLGIAQTGTGKTAAFALPILNNLFESKNQVESGNARALILTPTRELASQIIDNIKLYGQDLGLKYGLIFGGVNITNQIKNVKTGLDILVATPGRLLDLINQGHLKFSQLEIFVLDEADRMLDMGFINDVKKIISKLPKEKQTLFFSATMPKDIATLADSILNNPVRVEISEQSSTVDKIDQKVNLVEKANKPLLLKSIIENESDKSLFLVFSKTKHGANRVVEFLDKQEIKVAAIHGNKSQAAREKALESFRQGKIKVLVATDIAARGIDVAGITHVINFDIPNHPESYVHRIGRTGRAGREGVAISFCDNSEYDLLKNIEKLIKIKLTIDETHIFHGVKASAVAKSFLPLKERPKSGYKSSFKAKPNQDKEPQSYFSQTRRWKNGEKTYSQKMEENQRPTFKKSSFAKSSYNSELGKPNYKERFVKTDSNKAFNDSFKTGFKKTFREDQRQEYRSEGREFKRGEGNQANYRKGSSSAFQNKKPFFKEWQPREKMEGQIKQEGRGDLNRKTDRNFTKKYNSEDNGDYKSPFKSQFKDRFKKEERDRDFKPFDKKKINGRDKKPFFDSKFSGVKKNTKQFNSKNTNNFKTNSTRPKNKKK